MFADMFRQSTVIVFFVAFAYIAWLGFRSTRKGNGLTGAVAV